MEVDVPATATAQLNESGGQVNHTGFTNSSPYINTTTTTSTSNDTPTFKVQTLPKWPAVNGSVISSINFYSENTNKTQPTDTMATDSKPNGQLSFSSSLPPLPPMSSTSSSSLPQSPPHHHLNIEPPIEVSSHSTSPTFLKETTNLESMMMPSLNPLMDAISSSNLDLQLTSSNSSSRSSSDHHHHHHHHHQSKKGKKKKSKDKDKEKNKKSKHSKSSTDSNNLEAVMMTSELLTVPSADSDEVKLKKKKKKKSKDKDKDRKKSEKDGSKKKKNHHHPKSDSDLLNIDGSNQTPDSENFFQPSLLESALASLSSATASNSLAAATSTDPSGFDESNNLAPHSSNLNSGDSSITPATNSISLQSVQKQSATKPSQKKAKKKKAVSAATTSILNPTTITTSSTTSLPVIPTEALNILNNPTTNATNSSLTNPISLLLTPPPKRVRIRRKRDPNAPPAKRGRPFGAKTHPYKLKRNQKLIKQLQEQLQNQPQVPPVLPPEAVAALAGTLSVSALPASVLATTSTSTTTTTTTTTTPSSNKKSQKPSKTKMEENKASKPANQSTPESSQSKRSSTRIRKNSEIKQKKRAAKQAPENKKRDEKQKKSGKKVGKDAVSSSPEAKDSVSAIIDSVSQSTAPFSPPLQSPASKLAKKKSKTATPSPADTLTLEARVERVLAAASPIKATLTSKNAETSSLEKAHKRDRKGKKQLEKEKGKKDKKESSSSVSQIDRGSPSKDSSNLSNSSLLANSKVPLAITRTRFIGPVVRIIKRGADLQDLLELGGSPPKKAKATKDKKKKGKKSTPDPAPPTEDLESDNEFAMPFEYSVCQRQTQLDGRGMVEENESQSAGGVALGGSRSLQTVHQKLMADMGENTSPAGWTCAFCGLPPDVERLGDLYGPYYVDLVVTPDVDFELMPPPPCKLAHAVGRKRSRILANRLRPDDIQWQQYELWFHEDCIVWTPRVLLNPIGQLLFIEEAITEAKRTLCFVCKKPGATLSCFDKRCLFKSLHFPCAKKIGCYFDEQRMSIFCEGHHDIFNQGLMRGQPPPQPKLPTITDGKTAPGGRITSGRIPPQKILF